MVIVFTNQNCDHDQEHNHKRRLHFPTKTRIGRADKKKPTLLLQRGFFGKFMINLRLWLANDPSQLFGGNPSSLGHNLNGLLGGGCRKLVDQFHQSGLVAGCFICMNQMLGSRLIDFLNGKLENGFRSFLRDDVAFCEERVWHCLYSALSRNHKDCLSVA